MGSIPIAGSTKMGTFFLITTPKFPSRAFPVRILLMPTFKKKSNSKLQTPKSWNLRFGAWSFSTGFSLIEIVLSLFFVIALATILFSASGTLLHTRSGNLETVASKIAAKQIENLRNTDFTSIPLGVGTFADTTLSQLPNGTATRTITNYQSSTDIKDVLVTISYTENSAPKQIKMETLIYKNGL